MENGPSNRPCVKYLRRLPGTIETSHSTSRSSNTGSIVLSSSLSSARRAIFWNQKKKEPTKISTITAEA